MDIKNVIKNRSNLNVLLGLLLLVGSSFSAVYALPGDTANDPFRATGGTNQVGNCAFSYGFRVCTANDFRITNLTLSNVVDGCSSDTDYMQADLTVTFSKATPIRYDIMAYFYRGEEDGVAFDLNVDAAVSGDWCTRIGLEEGLDIFLSNGNDSGNDTSDIDGDETSPGSGIAACFDAPNGAQNGSITQTELGIVLPCRDGNTNNIVDISACTGWDNNASPSDCSGPEYDGVTEPAIGTGSKCNCAEFDTDPVVTIPDILVAKVCEGDSVNIPGTDDPYNGEYFNGDVVQCTITISNAAGVGAVDGATSALTEGFFYIDDYDEAVGSVGTVNINNPGGGNPSSTDDTPSAGMLSIYPDDIAAGDDVVVTYFYTIDTMANINSIDISNTVCLNYFDRAEITITGITQAGTAVVTYSGVDSLTDGEVVIIRDVVGMTEVNGNNYTIANVNTAANTFELLGIDSSAFTAYISGGIIPGSGTTTEYMDVASGDCATATITTTPVTLADFEVYREAGGLQFNWVTATETNNIGFNVYAAFGQTLYKINTDLIPSQMVSTLEPSAYSSWFDSNQYAQASEFYLEDVDMQGNTARHGPFPLSKFGASNAGRKLVAAPDTNWGQIKSQNARSRAKQKSKRNKENKGQSKKAGNSGSSASVVNIDLYAPGLQQVSLNGLSALGFSASDMAKGRYSLTNSAEGHVASRIVSANTGDYLEFIGVVERSFYSDKSVYQLHHASKPNSAAEITSASAGNGGAESAFYMHTETLDDDNRYVFTSKVVGDPWMINRIFAISNPATVSLVVPVSNVYQGAVDAQVTAELVGGIDFPNEVDHLVELRANSQLVSSIEFDGAVTAQTQGQVSMSGVSNELEVDLTLTPLNSIGVSLIYTNKVSLTYPREYVAIDNQLSFSSNDASFAVGGFNDQRVHAYASTGGVLSYIGELNASGGAISFTAVAGAESYQLYGDSTISNPSAIEVTSSDLTDLAAQHIVITHPDFSGTELDDYLVTRTGFSSGSSAVVTTDEIYTRYSGGLRDAQAIHAFIIDYAQNNDLQSVMIVGGDVYDYHDNLGIGAVSFVPTLYRATDSLIQYSPVDSVYGDLDDDGIPDVPVGRLPVRTVSELAILLDKMSSYADTQGDTTATFAADAQRDDSEYDFAASSDSLADVLETRGWNITKAYIDDLGAADTKTTLINSLNTGPRLALYTGHSAPSRWSADNIFSYQDTLALLNVNSPSAYLQWGCYNTYFSSPYSDSMSHGLMLAGDQGAAVVIGSSTLTDAVAEADFAALFQSEMIEPNQSYGEAFIQAKKSFAENGGSEFKDILWGVTLLGDPLLGL